MAQNTQEKAHKICIVGQAAVGKSCMLNRLQTGLYETDVATLGVSFVPYVVNVDKNAASKSQFQYYLSRFFSSPDHTSPYPTVVQPASPSAKVVPAPTDKHLVQARLNCWDTSGQDKFATLAKKYYLDAGAALVCFDLTDPASWEKLQFWVEQVQNVEPDCLIVIVGTKKDMIVPIPKIVKDKHPHEDFNTSRQRAIPVDEVRDYALSIGAVVFETTAKLDADLSSADHIFEVFNFVANELTFRREEARALGIGQKQVNPNQINMNQTPAQKKEGCC